MALPFDLSVHAQVMALPFEEPAADEGGGGGGGCAEGPCRRRSCWAEMCPDLLSNIFARLPFEQFAKDIPCICQAWRRICLQDPCWETMDLTHFTLSHGAPEAYRLMPLLFLLKRSQGRLRQFTFPSIAKPSLLDDLVFHAPLLQKLHIRSSCINYAWAEYAARVLTRIEDLDVSLCNSAMLHSGALAILGKHCRHIAILRRNKSQWMTVGPTCNGDALAIAGNYPVLKHLELQNNRLSAEGLRAILDNCLLLEYLDLRGCPNIAKDDALLSTCRIKLKVFHEPSCNAHFYKYYDSYKIWEDDLHDDDYEDSIWGSSM